MEKKLISIITVVYNCEITVENTLKSILSQTYENKELIVVDGKSTDNTMTIVSKYKDKIGTIISEPDKGIYDAMNKGVKYAKGDWICFMNSGDAFYNDNVLSQVSLQLTDDYGIVYGDTDSITQYGHIIDIAKTPNYIKENMPCCHQSCFAKRLLLLEYPFDLSYKIVADYNFVFQAYINGVGVKKIDVIVATYNAADGFSANNKYRLFKEILKIHNYGPLSPITIKLYLSYSKYFALEYLNQYFPSIVKAIRSIKHKF